MGDVAANQEPAIVVTGLKPNHYYNVRVIAVGSNNFQAGSRVVRLRTFTADGRPQLGNSRLPSNFLLEDGAGQGQGDYIDENGGPRASVPGLETATNPEQVASPGRDLNPATAAGPRRNTVTRRHSPSTASMEPPPPRDDMINANKTLPELTEKFESIRHEMDDVMALIAKEDAENKRVLDELEAEKQEKKERQKKKEEQTEKLKREVNTSDRAMRNATTRKAQRERQLKEKQAERTKFYDNIEKWETQVDEMRQKQERFDQQKRLLEKERDQKAEQLQEGNADLQEKCLQLEAELKEKREQVREAEEARKPSAGEEDGDWREKEALIRQERELKQREHHTRFVNLSKMGRKLDEQLSILNMQLQHIPVSPPQPTHVPYLGPSLAPNDYDNAALTQLKRRSRNANSLSSLSISSPLPPYSQVDPAGAVPGFASSRAANAPPGFVAPGPFMDMSMGMPQHLDEAGIRGASAPLSPSATSLLPANILDDLDDDPARGSGLGRDLFRPTAADMAAPNDPQSPASSGHLSLFSSPHGSTHNLAYSGYPLDDRRAPDPIQAPTALESSTNRLRDFFTSRRSQTAKGHEGEGPPLGSLKQGQSQSFPRQGEDLDSQGNKRRTTLSTSFAMFNRNSAGPDVLEHGAPISRFSARSFNPFSTSHRTVLAERENGSPRPPSTSSSDFPRPSTESGWIWGPLGGDSSASKSRNVWPSSEAPTPWSRTPSRRPSLHGSPSAMKTSLADVGDEILHADHAPDPKDVGVIGRPRPQTSKSTAAAAAAAALKPNLNPNAPAFIGNLFKPKSEKDSKSKAKDSLKSSSKAKSKGKDADTAFPLSVDPDSPPDLSRRSRDGTSVHTAASVSESRDSLSLDQPLSNTPSEPPSAKDDNVVRKLFRKSSSGKFSLPGRLGSGGGKDSVGGGLFKKGPGSIGGHSDRGFSMDRSSVDNFDEEEAATGGAYAVRSHESVMSSPGLAPTVSVKSSGGGGGGKVPTRWLPTFSSSKKGRKEKESLELDRGEGEGGEERV